MEMSTEKGSVLSKKNDSMLTVVALLLGLVAGIIVYQLTDTKNLLVILYVMLLVFGVYYLISMSYASDVRDFQPSSRSFRLVWGALLTTVGALMLMRTYGVIKEFWILLIVLLLVIAAVILYLFMNKRG
jgi:peptidoglycan/LPS O-acetylase OafA/YrhL